MCIPAWENHSLTLTLKKVGHVTQKCKKVKKLKCHAGHQKSIAEGFSALRQILLTKNIPFNLSLATVGYV